MYKLPIDLQKQLDKQITKNVRSAFLEMTERYRSGQKISGLSSNDEAMAYILARLPATYSVLRELFDKIATDNINSLLDIGAGPGHAIWAAYDRWPALEEATIIEPDRHMFKIQQELIKSAPINDVNAINSTSLLETNKSDLVICSYVLNELPLLKQQQMVEKAWQVTGKYMVIIYPGANRYFSDFLAIREQAINYGGAIIAPCPHAFECPIKSQQSDWCHFTTKVLRDKSHMKVKNGKNNHEDEKFTYLIVSKLSSSENLLQYDRIVKKPMQRKGHIVLDICTKNGSLDREVISKTDKHYKQAKKAKWGDMWH